MINISTYKGGDDCKLFTEIVNQGIDARLEAFTESDFYDESEYRFVFNFADNEASILLRRLSELADYDDNADSWLNDILSVYFDVEVI